MIKTPYIAPECSGLLPGAVDVRFAARLFPGGLVSVHRDTNYPDTASVAINSHVRFHLALRDCADVARIADTAVKHGAAAIELSTGEGLYLYPDVRAGVGKHRYRLCLGSPLRKTIRENEVVALATVLTCFAAYWEGSGA